MPAAKRVPRCPTKITAFMPAKIRWRRYLMWPRLFAAIAVLVGGSLAPAMAASPQLMGTFGDWKVYAVEGSNTRDCYVQAVPKVRSPDGLRRDPGSMFVTHHAGRAAMPEIAVSLGFPLRTGSSHSLQIGGRSFMVYGKGENGWPQNDGDQGRIVELMKAGQQLTIVALTGRGHRNIDTFSLTGFTKAWDLASRNCR